MAEVYAAFSEYTDVQIGRVIDYLEDSGQLDNTLILYCADNGASGEGSPNGSVNENRFFNGYPDDINDNMAMIDKLGGPDTYNHYPTGWAVAFSTPYRMFKRYSQYAGGTADPLIIHWPKGIKAKGEVRHQYHHCTDVVPTILDCCGVEFPEVVDGVKQEPLVGVSMRYSFDNAKAPTRKETQYYEMLSTRGIWHKGWKAATEHGPLIDIGKFDQDRWQLFNIEEDRAEAKDLAAQYPEKVKELAALWLAEAKKYNVLPLNDLGIVGLHALANEAYVESLARIVYYWGDPAVDAFGRTSGWEVMKKSGPGATLGLFPGAPKNRMGYLDDYMPPAQRKVVTPNNDTIYGVGFADLREENAVIQTPSEVPKGHYWTIQICDAFTTVIRQLGSASKTPGGKFLLVGPGWQGQKPAGFVDVVHSPTHVAGVFFRSFTAHTAESKAEARAVLNQIGMVPESQDKAGPLKFDCEASARNKVYPPGLTAEMLAADPDLLRIRPVNPNTFWDDLKKALDANPVVGSNDAPMADQARTLLALRDRDPAWHTPLDRVALAADAELHDSAKYHQVGVDVGNGWQRQENGGEWGTDWFGRAQAAIIYIYVNDYHEAIYFIRGTDSRGELLQGRYDYKLTFPKNGLPPVDRERGGFWSLTMYDKDYYMLPNSPNGRTNIGIVNLDANELQFAKDGSLTLTLSSKESAGAEAKANWLPAPNDQFALIVRTYVPTEALLNGTYKLPNVERA